MKRYHGLLFRILFGYVVFCFLGSCFFAINLLAFYVLCHRRHFAANKLRQISKRDHIDSGGETSANCSTPLAITVVAKSLSSILFLKNRWSVSAICRIKEEQQKNRRFKHNYQYAFNLRCVAINMPDSPEAFRNC